jgi:hypothetical protein
MRDVEVGFTGDEMKVVCLPADLPRVYAAIKAAVSKTNHDYVKLRESTIQQVRERDRLAAERARATKAAEVKSDADAEQAWDKLEL